MANVVIHFDSNEKQKVQPAKKQTEIYTDISLLSKFRNAYKSVIKRDLIQLNLNKTDNSQFLAIDDNDSPLLVSATSLTENTSTPIYKVSKSINVKAVQNAIQNIFSFFPGERVLYPEFGSRLKMHLYNGITLFNQERIVSEIYSNLELFDQRVIVKDIAIVTSDKDKDDNTVTLRIIYCIDGLPDEYYTYDYSYVSGD